MHRLNSAFTILRFRFAAVLLCAKWLLFPVAIAVLIHSLITLDHQLAIIGVGALVLSLLMTILLWLFAARTGCPLCMTPVLARKHCMTHRHAKSFLGSHRLQVALAILFRNSFQCPYCNEPTAMAVREKKPPTTNR